MPRAGRGSLRARAWGEPQPVSAMTRAEDPPGSWRIRSHACQPSSPGIPKSRMAMSGMHAAAASTAAWPSRTTTAESPNASMNCPSVSPASALSSAIKTRRVPLLSIATICSARSGPRTGRRRALAPDTAADRQVAYRAAPAFIRERPSGSSSQRCGSGRMGSRTRTSTNAQRRWSTGTTTTTGNAPRRKSVGRPDATSVSTSVKRSGRTASRCSERRTRPPHNPSLGCCNRRCESGLTDTAELCPARRRRPFSAHPGSG